MTTTKALVKIDNPYWTAIQGNPDADYFWQRGNERVFARWPKIRDEEGNFVKFDYESLALHREAAVKLWSWAIPDPETLAYIVEILDGRSVVEIGAGTGYWAYLLDQYGVDVTCYDSKPIRDGENPWFTGNTYEWHPVLRGGPRMLKYPINHNKVLFLCWPPYKEAMGYQSLRNFKGDTLIYIGEEQEGCTGDPEFFDLLEREWEVTGWHEMSVWEGIHDSLFVYTRKAKTPKELP